MSNNSPEAACVGKTPFMSWDQANHAMKQHRRFEAIGGRGSIKIYRCPYCPNWHIGHGLTKKKKRK